MLTGAKRWIATSVTRFLDYWTHEEQRHRDGIHPKAVINIGSIVAPGVALGRYSCVNGPGTVISSGSIGAFCSISWGVTIGPTDHALGAVTTHRFWCDPLHPLGPEQPQTAAEKAPPHIGHDVWIGCHATVLKGAVIEDGAVIGAGAVVSGRIPAYAVAVGVPARVIRFRFDQTTAAALRETRWWEAGEEELARLRARFEDPAAFLAAVTEGATLSHGQHNPVRGPGGPSSGGH